MMKSILSLIFMAFASVAFAQESFTLGADLGWLTEMESKGVTWKNWKGQKQECTALMKDMGMNAVRIRVWVDPSKHGNWCGKEDVLVKALKAKALGMDIMIDFHYSDWWADPAKQNIPQAWEKMSYKKMVVALADHTKEVLTMLRDNGVTPRWVQVGNETSHGLLWSVEMDPVTGWEKKDAQGNTTIVKAMGHIEQNPKQYAGFIGAGYDAVKSIFPEAQVIVHLDNGFDNDLYNYNLDKIIEGGGKWDVIGMSLYPYWSIKSGRESTAQRTIVDCIRNIRKLSSKYNCDVMIVETGFEVDEENPWKMEEGRLQYEELIKRAKTETGGRCKGVFYWEPECLPKDGYKLGAFDNEGRPTSIMRALLDYQDISHYDRKLVNIETTEGNILVELYNETPIHRDNFLRLATSGALENTLFHRVIEDFMVQAGDPTSKDAPATSKENPAKTLGGSDVPLENGETTLPAEINYPKSFHKRGALAAAREGDDSNPAFRSSSSQFYIVWGNSPATRGRHPYKSLLPYYSNDEHNPGTPWLDGGYTVFGEVIKGLDIVEKIQSAPTDSHDRPLTDIRIISMKVMN